jgi:LPS export ABC transporter protein LptC
MTPRQIAKLLAGTGLAALVVIIGAAMWVVHSRDRQQRLLERSVRLVPGALLHANNFHWTEMKGDQELWELRAKEANYSNSRTSARLKGAMLTMTLTDGKPFALKASDVHLVLTGNHVDRADFSGGLLIDYNGMEVSTDQAVFFPDRDQLQASGLVRIVGPDFTVSGTGLEAHPRAQTFSLQRQVDTLLTSQQHGAAKQS